MFSEFLGYLRMDKKWAKLLGLVRSDNEEDYGFIVDVSRHHILATDAGQVIRIERPIDVELIEGYYILADRLFVQVPEDKLGFKFPDFSDKFNRDQFTKTAVLEIKDYPLLSMAQAIMEFNVIIDIDKFRRVVEAIAAFKPTYIRVYGFVDAAPLKPCPLKFEFMVEEDGHDPVVVEYVVMPLKLKPDDFVKVDKQPMLFDLKKAS